jgi:hypothetical protein
VADLREGLVKTALWFIEISGKGRGLVLKHRRDAYDTFGAGLPQALSNVDGAGAD